MTGKRANDRIRGLRERMACKNALPLWRPGAPAAEVAVSISSAPNGSERKPPFLWQEIRLRLDGWIHRIR